MDKDDVKTLLLVGTLVMAYDVFLLTNNISNFKNYTYYRNGAFGVSNECFVKDDNAYCVIDDEETKVDLYYEVEE